jgi:uncharacterized cofD-like protein
MNIVVIGGGTGTTTVLEGLKKNRDLHLSVIVGMMDDGGSNAVIRDEFGLLPLSDLRKSIIALADDGNNHILRELFTYRFANGEKIKGHTMGNLLMIAMTDIMNGEVEAIEMFKTLFNVRGDIIPVTLDDVKLVAKYSDGTKVVGEHLIDEPEIHKDIEEFYLDSEAKIFNKASEAIRDADYIVIGPGDVYTTTLQSLIVKGFDKAISKSKAKIIFITNLMSKIGQTRNKTQKDILNIVEEYLGRKVDYVILNKGEIPEGAMKRYIDDGENILEDDLQDGDGRKVLRVDVVANDLVKDEQGDTLKRSFVRHDGKKLEKVLYGIFKGKGLRRVLSKILAPYLD